MNKTQLLEKNIRALVKDGKTLDLEYFVILDELNFAALLQAVRHHAETVFTYRINAAQGVGRDYRSQELFSGRATQLYSCLAPFSDSDIGVVRTLELWLLEDFSFAVVANMQVILGEGAIMSEYRVVKTCEFSEIHTEIPINLTDFARNLRDMCRDYEKAIRPPPSRSRGPPLTRLFKHNN